MYIHNLYADLQGMFISPPWIQLSRKEKHYTLKEPFFTL